MWVKDVQAFYCRLVIKHVGDKGIEDPTLGILRQEHPSEFVANLSYIVKFKQKQTNKKQE